MKRILFSREIAPLSTFLFLLTSLSADPIRSDFLIANPQIQGLSSIVPPPVFLLQQRFQKEGNRAAGIVEFRNGPLFSSNGETLKHNGVAASFQIENDWLYVGCGKRFHPGARNSFFIDPLLVSPFRDIPDSRTLPTLFLSVMPGLWFGGLLFIDRNHKPGFFLADRQRRTFIAWHPDLETGAASLHVHNAHHSSAVDLLYDRGTLEGHVSLTGTDGERTGSRYSIEIERNAQWDDTDRATGTRSDRRTGKSGRMDLNGTLFVSHHASLKAEFAGIDRAQKGDRMKGLSLFVGDGPLFPFLRMRSYRTILYGSSLAPRENGAVATGIEIRRDGSFLSFAIEAREQKGCTGEVQAEMNAHRIKAAVSYIATNGHTPLFIRFAPERGSDARFYDGTEEIIAVKIESDFLYIDLRSTLFDHRPATQINLQAKLTF